MPKMLKQVGTFNIDWGTDTDIFAVTDQKGQKEIAQIISRLLNKKSTIEGGEYVWHYSNRATVKKAYQLLLQGLTDEGYIIEANKEDWGRMVTIFKK